MSPEEIVEQAVHENAEAEGVGGYDDARLTGLRPINGNVLVTRAARPTHTQLGLLVPGGISEITEALSGFVVAIAPDVPSELLGVRVHYPRRGGEIVRDEHGRKLFAIPATNIFAVDPTIDRQ